MPERAVIERARKKARQGRSPSTQAGEFVHEEIEHIREGKHGAQSTKQAIAIGLSKARKKGKKVPKKAAKRKTSKKTAKKTSKKTSRKTRKTSKKTSKRKSSKRSR